MCEFNSLPIGTIENIKASNIPSTFLLCSLFLSPPSLLNDMSSESFNKTEKQRNDVENGRIEKRLRKTEKGEYQTNRMQKWIKRIIVRSFAEPMQRCSCVSVCVYSNAIQLEIYGKINISTFVWADEMGIKGRKVGNDRKNKPYLSWHTFHCDKSEKFH